MLCYVNGDVARSHATCVGEADTGSRGGVTRWRTGA